MENEDKKELTIEMFTKYFEENSKAKLYLFLEAGILAIKGLLVSKDFCSSEEFDKLVDSAKNVLIKRDFDSMSENDKSILAKHIDNEKQLAKFSSLLGFDLSNLI